MRKLILILSLFTLGVKAQIVGGFVPLNSTKTFTSGGAKINGNLNVTGTGSIGSTFTVTGAMKASSTMSLGSANLTGGNTGTVAVLSDAVFNVNYSCYGTGTPADGATYYIGNSPAALVSSSWGNYTLPYNCTLVAWQLNWYGTPGSAENSTIIINGTTNYTLTSAAIFSAAATVGTYSSSGLSQSFSANDVENIKWICPTWATNPVGLFLGVTLWFVRRS
jgi:hypothetical protein